MRIFSPYEGNVAIENEKAAVNRTAYRAGDIAGQEGMPSGRWEEVFQGINQLIMILDPEHVILEANRAVQEATGLSGEELRGETCYQVFHGADEPPPGCPLVALLASGRPETSEMDVEIFGRMFLVSVTPLFDDRGRLERIVHVATDITERKQAEEQLSTEMDKARQYLDVAGVMLIALDAHGEITLINTKGCEILGADQKEILGKNWFDAFLPKRLVEEVRSVYDKSMKGEIEQVEYYENPIRTKTGEERIIAWHNALLRDASGKIIGLLSSGEDITERKRAEEALAHERDLLQALMDNMPDTIYFKDTASRFTRINKAQAQALGVRDPQEVTGKTDSDFFADEHARAAYADEQKMVETGEALIAKEEKVRRADGTFHWVSATKVPIKDAAGHVTGIVGISRDITERKQAEEALRESEEQYRTTLNSMDSCIHVIDEDFRIILFNEAFERFNKKLGLTTNALGLPLSEVFPFLTENVYDEYRRVFENGETIVTEDKYEFESEIIFTECHKIPVVKSGKVEKVVTLLRDVTEHKRLETQLLQAQKMEAVGHLAGGVAHDFNNILTVILGYAAFTQRTLSPDDELFQNLEQIRTAGEKAAVLTRQLLAFSRQQIMQPKDLNINEVVDGLLKMIWRVIGEDIDLKFISGRQLGTVHADPGQIEQILMNLCVNARDAMPKGGTLTLETENVLIGEGYRKTHPWVDEGRYVLISVTDTGHGMDEETRSQVFEPFFTTKEVGKGTGLGLATVYGIVKQHDGMIDVYSEVGKGTTFKVYLPIVERQAEEVGNKIEGPARGGTETLLFAEDHESLRRMTLELLETAGYTVLVATDGQEALEVFEAHADEISLVLLDVVMPKLSGRDVCDRIRAINPDVRTLFTSGYSANAIHTRFVLDEGIELIRKPYDMHVLLRKIREALDRK